MVRNSDAEYHRQHAESDDSQDREAAARATDALTRHGVVVVVTVTRGAERALVAGPAVARQVLGRGSWQSQENG